MCSATGGASFGPCTFCSSVIIGGCELVTGAFAFIVADVWAGAFFLILRCSEFVFKPGGNMHTAQGNRWVVDLGAGHARYYAVGGRHPTCMHEGLALLGSSGAIWPPGVRPEFDHAGALVLMATYSKNLVLHVLGSLRYCCFRSFVVRHHVSPLGWCTRRKIPPP